MPSSSNPGKPDLVGGRLYDGLRGRHVGNIGNADTAEGFGNRGSSIFVEEEFHAASVTSWSARSTTSGSIWKSSAINWMLWRAANRRRIVSTVTAVPATVGRQAAICG